MEHQADVIIVGTGVAGLFFVRYSCQKNYIF